MVESLNMVDGWMDGCYSLMSHLQEIRPNRQTGTTTMGLIALVALDESSIKKAALSIEHRPKIRSSALWQFKNCMEGNMPSHNSAGYGYEEVVP